ncbi:hypothetical protein D3C85_1003800 [compost metagenome]
MSIAVPNDTAQRYVIEKVIKRSSLIVCGAKQSNRFGNGCIAFAVFLIGREPHQCSHVLESNRVKLVIPVKATHDKQLCIVGQVKLRDRNARLLGN